MELAYLGYLPLIPLVGSRHVVCQRLRAGKVMVAARGGHDVALAGDLSRKSSNRTGDYLTNPPHTISCWSLAGENAISPW